MSSNSLRHYCMFASAILSFAHFSHAQVATAAARLSISQAVSEVAGWTIGKNENAGGCLAAATYQDGTTIWVGFNAQGDGVIGFTNPAWQSIEVGQIYAVQMRDHGGRNWKGSFVGTERGNEKGIIAEDVKVDFLVDFARAGGIGVFIAGKTIAKLSLSGSSSALEAVASCKRANGTEASPSSPDQARRAPESDSRGGSSGTGFFVSDKGHILTNNHVVEGCKKFWALVPGEPQHNASVVATDETNDLALLLLNTKPTIVPSFNNKPKVGENVFVYGFPLTGLLATSGNFTVGNIDKNGNILGVIVSKLNVSRVADATGDIPQNVNFAIKASIATNFLESNNISPHLQLSLQPLEATAVAEISKSFTVHVVCEQ